MSGGALPYQLRQNKAIERALFVDLLQRVARAAGCNISDYKYFGFGGPFMEDFKLLHGALRIKKMVSIEKSETVARRQKFNAPISGIEYFVGDSSEFVTNFERQEPSIVWLDYMSPANLKTQLLELSGLIAKLSHGDILKITLNASPSALERDKTKKGIEMLEHRMDVFSEGLGGLAPTALDPAKFNLTGYPIVLNNTVRRSVERSVLHSDYEAIPLAAFSYKDGQQMYTLTGVVVTKAQKDQFIDSTRLVSWPMNSLGWADPHRISVPNLSIRERVHLESLLPDADAEELEASLGYGVDDESEISASLLESFVKFYRFMPQYGRVAF